MNKKIIKVFEIVETLALITIIFNSIIHMINGTNMPTLEFFSFLILMICLIFSSHQQFNERKMSKAYSRNIIIFALVSGIAYIGIYILRIYSIL